MISYARQNTEEQPESTVPSADDHIAPAPRVSVQAFCETVETAAAVQAAGEDRRLGKAHLKSDLADSALAGLAALEEGGAAAGEQVDVLLDKGRDLIDSAADLIRERPIASFGVAFATGWIIAKLARSGKW